MAKTKPLISIIVPMYNSARYIEECIESILLQDYPNIELLLVDDHSVDDTVEVCKKYIENEKVRLIPNNKKGVSSARNLGIKNANGEYLVFVDSDDVVARTYISTLYEISIAHPDYLAMCGLCTFGDKLPDFDTGMDSIPQELDASVLLANIFYYHSSACAALFKSDVLSEHGILMTEDASFNEDVYFTSKYLCECKGGARVPARLYGYRVNPSGIGAHKSHADLTKVDVEHRAKGYYSFQDALRFAESVAPMYVKYIDVGYSFIAAEVVLTSARAKTKDFKLKNEVKSHLTLGYCIKFLKFGKSTSQKLLVLGMAFWPSLIKVLLDDMGMLKIKVRRGRSAC